MFDVNTCRAGCGLEKWVLTTEHLIGSTLQMHACRHDVKHGPSYVPPPPANGVGTRLSAERQTAG